MKQLLLFFFTGVIVHSYCHSQIITTVVGGGTGGLGDGGQATDCELNAPELITKDGAGNLYIADRENSRIRKVTAGGVITTIAGTGVAGYSGDSGPATLAALNGPFAIALSTSGDVFFSDMDNHCIRKINSTGTISTVAGTGALGFNGDGIQATAAQLSRPAGVSIDNIGNIYFADNGNHRVRKIDLSGVISTIAGSGTSGYTGDNGPATDAQLNEPGGIALDLGGNIYVAEYMNNSIRKVDASGIITTIAGGIVSGYSGDGGPATSARLKKPIGISISAFGYVYIADTWNNCIREINPKGMIGTVAGTGTLGFAGDGGNATAAKLSKPTGVYVDATNSIYIADWGNDRIRTLKVPTSSSEIIAKSYSTFDIYPNPSKGQFTVTTSTNSNEQIRLIICNISGNKVAEYIGRSNRPMLVHLDVPNGIYLMQLILRDHQFFKEIQIAR
jgi:trimeric autotransporter adhesin